MGHADLRVRSKIFASLPNDARMIAIKTAPVDLDLLVAADPKTFRSVWGGRWLGVDLGRVPRATLRRLLIDAWRLTAPKRLVAAHPELSGDT
jgi:hypothetical protein